MSAAADVLFALEKYYRQEPNATVKADKLLARYKAELLADAPTGRLRDFTVVWTASDGSDIPATELRCVLCGHLVQGVGPHTLLDLTALADSHHCQNTAAAPDFFQVGRTYTEPDGSTDWAFRCDTITTHPADGERTALGWRHFRGEWSEYAYGEDDFQIHLIADAITTTETEGR
ncbi:MAG TPA: hypothetical protein VIP28_10765 [Nocardioides sp.]